MGLFDRFRNFMHSLSPEGMYEQAEQAYNEGDLGKLNAIHDDFMDTFPYSKYNDNEIPEREKLNKLYFTLMCQKEDEVLSRYQQDLVKSEDDFSGDTKWFYRGLEHPDDSTLVSLYFPGNRISYENLRLKISYSDSNHLFSKVIFSNDNKELFTLQRGVNGINGRWTEIIYTREDMRGGATWTEIDISLERYLTSTSVDNSKYNFHPILRYFNKSLSNGNGLKIRLITDYGAEVNTRELSQTEIAGLRHMIAAQFETSNYIRGLLGIDLLPTEWHP